jgi:hypothetical protein
VPFGSKGAKTGRFGTICRNLQKYIKNSILNVFCTKFDQNVANLSKLFFKY